MEQFLFRATWDTGSQKWRVEVGKIMRQVTHANFVKFGESLHAQESYFDTRNAGNVTVTIDDTKINLTNIQRISFFGLMNYVDKLISSHGRSSFSKPNDGQNRTGV